MLQQFKGIGKRNVVPDSFSTIPEKEWKVVEIELGNTVTLRFRVDAAKIVGDSVGARHTISDGEIIEHRGLALPLKGIKVCHVEADIRQWKVDQPGLKVLAMTEVNPHGKRCS